jgi:hypothetical protein
VGDPNGSSRTIKVVDRRKFTADGEPIVDDVRGEASDGVGESTDASPASSGPDAAAESQPPAPEPLPRAERASTVAGDAAATTSPEFLELVAVLAQQAEMLLAGADDIPAQPEGARRMIDYLGALESKTEGNLSPDESQALSSILYQLRTLFVQSSG